MPWHTVSHDILLNILDEGNNPSPFVFFQLVQLLAALAFPRVKKHIRHLYDIFRADMHDKGGSNVERAAPS